MFLLSFTVIELNFKQNIPLDQVLTWFCRLWTLNNPRRRRRKSPPRSPRPSAEHNRPSSIGNYGVKRMSFSQLCLLDTPYSVIYVSNRTTEKLPRPSTSSKPSQMSP